MTTPRLTPNQKDRLTELGRRSRRLSSNFYDAQSSYSAFAAGEAIGAWVDVRNIGGRATLDTLVSKGYALRTFERGPRGASHPFYMPTLAGWAWLVRQHADAVDTVIDRVAREFASDPLVAADGTVRNALGNFVGIDQPSAAEALASELRAAAARDPLCRNCGAPDSWHSEDDGQCPDDDGPHYDSAAAYDARELHTR